MENSFQTSFIPKKPMTTVVSTTRSTTSLVTVFFVLLLVGMGAAAGGLYFYKIYLTNQRGVLSQSLVKASDTFEQETISELELFDKRTTVSKQILSSHIILSPLFSLLGDLTVPAVQYTKFEHKTTDKGFAVSLSGTARDYKSIALQADAFNSAKGRSFKNVVFSNLTKEAITGNVIFDIQFTVDPSLLSYSKSPDTLATPATTTLTQPAPVALPTTLIVPTTPTTPASATALPAAPTPVVAPAATPKATSTTSTTTQRNPTIPNQTGATSKQ
jgi:hypothetical protein